MRARDKLVVVSIVMLTLVGCRPACKNGTLLLTLQLDATTGRADHLQVAVALPSGTLRGSPAPHNPGSTQGTLEVDFKGAYPASQTATVTVTAIAGGQAIGTGTQTATLTPGCKALAISIASHASGGPDGGTCSPASCPNGFCVDGVCCNSPCTGECEACDSPGSVGTCVAISGAPHGERVACAGAGTPCAGSCDGTNHTGCSYPGPQTSCGQQACVGGTKTLAVSCDGAGNCPAPESLECTPATCNASGTDCAQTCSSDGDCAAFAGKPHCDHGVCTAHLPLGGSCAGNADCNSATCVDGYCCDQACTGACQACDVSGHEGSCTPVTSGQPHGARGACGGAGGCAGACAPGQTQSCTFPSGACGGGTCANASNTPQVFCSGGTCPSLHASTCPGNLGCNSSGTGCLTGACNGDSDCQSGYYCASDGTCKAQIAQGSACMPSDCKGQSNCRVCGGGSCVDGYCCDRACSGTCEACDVGGHEGTCTPVPGGQQPHGARKPGGCGGDPGCEGACDGLPAGVGACTYKTGQCAAPSCSSGVLTQAKTCNASGGCIAPTPPTVSCSNGNCASPSACGGCTSDAQCGGGKYCDPSGNCVAQLGAGQICARTAMCSTNFCVDGYCCLTACDSGPCQNCKDNPGTCTYTGSASAPAQPVSGFGTTRGACPGSGACQEACNGASASCADVNAGVTCVAQGCSGGTETDKVTCSGGSCAAPATKPCGAYVCNTNGFCYASCTADSQCVAGNYCNAGGQCVPQKGIGATCASTDCYGGNCAECSTAGGCVDGVCCSGACTGACMTCNGTSPGTCTVAKSGTAPRAGQCAGNNFACNGYCDGSSGGCSWPTGVCRSTNGCSGTCSGGSCLGAGQKCGTSNVCCPCGCIIISGQYKCAICPP